MATVINNPTSDRVVDDGASAAGWMVALIIALAVIGGLFYWMRMTPATPAQTDNGSLNIDVNVPNPAGGTSGDGAGATQPPAAQ